MELNVMGAFHPSGLGATFLSSPPQRAAAPDGASATHDPTIARS
jgi:hypothetical protein